MKLTILTLCALLGCTVALPFGLLREEREANACNYTDCVLPNCRCSSTNIPNGLAPLDTPQIVLLTYDDAVHTGNIDFYRKALYNRVNPNNCNISATFFISHEYADYSLANELYSKGLEVALHSISHVSDTSYWRDATVDTLTKEFGGERELIAKFANIPINDIKGLRMPFLQMAGNNQFQMMTNVGLDYDLSWPTRNYVEPGMWPYTLKYASTQDCQIGKCPTESYPKVWVIPMLQWENDNGNHTCAMIDACVNYMDKERPNNTFEWMKTEFLKQYEGNRTPLGLFLHAAWFLADPARFDAYNLFLDYLGTLPDVYLLSGSDTIDYVKAPKNSTEMIETPCKPLNKPDCAAINCPLRNSDGNERYMMSCVACPRVYPWVDNPLGE